MCRHRIRFASGTSDGDEEDEDYPDFLAGQTITIDIMINFPGSDLEVEEVEEVTDESPIGEHTGTYVRFIVFAFVAYQFVINYLMA